MLTADTLRAVRTIVTHDSCSDGVASAIILRTALPEAQVVFVQYGTRALAELPAEPGMLFCDMSPPAERASEFVDAGAVVLDHHATARPVVEAFGERGVFGDEKADPGVSGAVLALRAVGEAGAPPAVRELATLVGIRDTWQRASPRWDEAIAVHEALLFWPRDRWLAAPPREWPAMLQIGAPLVARHAEAVRRGVERAYRFVAAGVRVVMLDSVSLSSDAAERLDKEADLVVGFGFRCDADGKLALVFSLRSHTDFDCAAWAKHEGGGGHTRAAGFNVTLAPFDDATPYRILRDRLARFRAASPQ